MRVTRVIYFICFFLFLLVLSSCSPKQQDQELPSAVVVDNSQNQVFQILELDPINSSTPTLSKPTSTLEPTPSQVTPTLESPISSSVPSPYAITSSPTPACINRAEFVKNLNLGDYTQLKTGEAFAKIWRIKNIGSCIWTKDYKLFFIDGNIMGGPEFINIAQEVMPGETVDLRVGGVAPIIPNEYSSKWMFQDEWGNVFGIGESASQPLAILILVTQFTDEFDPDPGPT